MKRTRGTLVCLFTVALLASGLAAGMASAKHVAAAETIISDDVRTEIEAGTKSIPVVVTVQISAEQSDLLRSQQQAVDALKKQNEEKALLLEEQLSEAAEQVRTGNMTQEEYESFVLTSRQEFETSEETLITEREQLLQNAKEISENEFRNKLTLWSVDSELRYVTVEPESCTYGVSGKLSPSQIETISKDSDVQSIALQKSMDTEAPTEPEPQQIYGDFNHDGVVNASDAAVILTYAAANGAGAFTGTFEEYVNIQ